MILFFEMRETHATYYGLNQVIFIYFFKERTTPPFKDFTIS